MLRHHTGCLLLTVHPSTQGGGVKDENTQLAKSRAASTLLDHGVSLSTATHTVDELLGKIGARPVLNALQASSLDGRWQALAQVARDAHIPLPKTDGRTEKAAARIQKTFRRRRAQQESVIQVADFALLEGTWRNEMDEQPVPILDAIGPEMAGVLLLDAKDATASDLNRLSAAASDAFCIIVPGHSCPDPPTCSGPVSVPVLHRHSACQHLIAACHHNLGCVNIVPYSCQNAEVTASATICCSFVMFRDECSSPEMWTRLAQHPVRAIADAFRASGPEQPFANPWDLSFRSGGKPSAPELADTFMVQAKVSQDNLRPALKRGTTGHTWEHQPLPGWAVVTFLLVARQSGHARLHHCCLQWPSVPGQH